MVCAAGCEYAFAEATTKKTTPIINLFMKKSQANAKL
jgi:hypothetical protein